MNANRFISLRKNASQWSIDEAIATLTTEWEYAANNAPVLFEEVGMPVYDYPGTYYLKIGGVVRWGYSFGFSAWGYDKGMVDREIAGQKEARYR